MSARLGLFFVLISISLGFVIQGGNLTVLLQPGEWLIVLGMTIGNFMISNSRQMQKDAIKVLFTLGREKSYNKRQYLDLLMCLHTLFKTCGRDAAAMDSHIENPNNSSILKRYPSILRNLKITTLLCDYIRAVTIIKDPDELEDMMDNSVEEYSSESNNLSQAFQNLGDALPGIGIVAAVLGVIISMSSIGAEPALLGAKVAAAMLGTFIGVFMAYGLVLPIGNYVWQLGESRTKFIQCLKVAVAVYARGGTLSVIIECTRQSIPICFRPSFNELELLLGS